MTQLQSLADAPNTLREYETIYILKPDTSNSQLADINEKVKGIIEGMKGKVVNVDNWGKRKLAYEVKKQLKGIFLYWQYLGETDLVAEVERNMRMMDPVIRYMTINTKNNVKVDEIDELATQEVYEKAAITAADEEELMTGRGSSSSSEPYYASADEYLGFAEEQKASDNDDAPAAEASEESAETNPAETNSGEEQ